MTGTRTPVPAAILATILAVTLGPAPLAAQSLQAEVLIQGLSRADTAPRTRSMRPAQPVMAEDQRAFLRSLSTTRSLVEEERAELVTIATTYELPQVDVQILFDFNSDSLRPDSFPDLLQIARALQSPELDSQRFVVAGHTDGVGSAAYNLDLSQRRAESVRGFLIATGIAPERLIPVGFGFERLKLPADPRADENRRVELINLEVGWQ